MSRTEVTGWSPQKHFFFQKIIILAIIKIISKSSAAWTAVFVYSCGSSLKFSPKDHGRPDPRTWRRASRAACGPFWELEKLSNCVKSGKHQKLLQKKLDFLSFFDVFSICFVFVRFFRSFFSFLLLILVGFSRFWIQFDKIPKLQTTAIFFFVFFFFVFFSFFFRTIFEPKRHFQFILESQKQFSIYFRIKKEFLNYFRSWNTFWFVFAITGAIATVIHSDLRDPGKICCNKLKRHVLGTFRDDGKLTSYFRQNRWWFCDVLGDDENDNKLKKNIYFWISNVWLAEICWNWHKTTVCINHHH